MKKKKTNKHKLRMRYHIFFCRKNLKSSVNFLSSRLDFICILDWISCLPLWSNSLDASRKSGATSKKNNKLTSLLLWFDDDSNELWTKMKHFRNWCCLKYFKIASLIETKLPRIYLIILETHSLSPSISVIACLPVVGEFFFYLVLAFRNNRHTRIAKVKRKYHQWKYVVTKLIECWCSIDGHEREIFMYSMSNITKNRKSNIWMVNIWRKAQR